MKKSCFYHVTGLLLFIMTFFISCSGQEKPADTQKKSPSDIPLVFPFAYDSFQIASYVRNIHQDYLGNLWFGTNGSGVARFDGDTLMYFLPGHQITGISENSDHNIWFATDHGVVKFEWSGNNDPEKQFTHYTKEYFAGKHQFWSIYADMNQTIWAGSATGIFQFDGINWTPFKLPYPEKVDSTGNFITKGTTWSITEDRNGHMWFSTNGFGAFKYDGKNFTQYSEKEGLTDNCVDQIMEDSKGNIWFGTRFGGVSRYNGMSFYSFTEPGIIGNNEVCVIYEDKKGNIWFSSEGYGVYRFDGTSLTNFGVKDGLGVTAVQSIFEDKEGRFWVGGGGGLYRFDGKSFYPVTKSGPWK